MASVLENVLCTLPHAASMAPLCFSCRYNVPIIDSYNISYVLFNSHVSAPQSIAGIIDCLHFCRPSLAEVGSSNSST